MIFFARMFLEVMIEMHIFLHSLSISLSTLMGNEAFYYKRTKGNNIMEQARKEKLEQIVALVDDLMVDPDLDIEYCVPEVSTTAESCDVSGEPYILIKYVISVNNVHTRKIRLTETYLRNTPEEIRNLITFSAEEFKGEIDSVEIG
ncbi:MAG: Unknown protein [uncultured Sulfurovum sp.]|uniref:Uncharacterized protein n=1 Tax=uncultured Sulfurovum sp. TaxID=269237 RepID=A0A6S6SLY4_9BACT|nr:MAG: Unknown protein [uncultured Sulfurovum sp.]